MDKVSYNKMLACWQNCGKSHIKLTLESLLLNSNFNSFKKLPLYILRIEKHNFIFDHDSLLWNTLIKECAYQPI